MLRTLAALALAVACFAPGSASGSFFCTVQKNA